MARFAPEAMHRAVHRFDIPLTLNDEQNLPQSMIFSENRYPPIRSKPEGMLFRTML
jgi:hypothetical protein